MRDRNDKNRWGAVDRRKIQIAVRLDKKVMDLAYDHVRQRNERISDFIERGIRLAIREDTKQP